MPPSENASTADIRRTALVYDSTPAPRGSKSLGAPGASSPGRWHRLRPVQSIGWMLLLAGCTVGPDFVQPKAPVPEQWQEADSAAVTRMPAERHSVCRGRIVSENAPA